jgi:adenosine deaminase
MPKVSEETLTALTRELIFTISETNGLSLKDTLELLTHSISLKHEHKLEKLVVEFSRLLGGFQQDEVDIYTLLSHPVSKSFQRFFVAFPLPYHEEHIHLTGSLSASFIYPRLAKLLAGPLGKVYEDKIVEVYGASALPITCEEDVDDLIRLKEGEQFKTYLRILYLAKLVLNSRQAHSDAAYHMASELYQQYNVGSIRLKFTLSRATGNREEQIPGLENVTEDDVVLGLYEGFKKFQAECPSFGFILSPSFRKEADFYDQENFKTKEDHFLHQCNRILEIVKKYPELTEYMVEVDTVGDEKELYRKKHFHEMKAGLRRLQYYGFKIRSHHGETWKNLRRGIQSVDNAMNIWHIDTLEHGLSLGINPNFYFHRLYQRVLENNKAGVGLAENRPEYHEIMDMNWHDLIVRDKILQGVPLTENEATSFLKTKFHTAREIEHYQHDVLNRMIQKQVSLVALPSSNMKLTGAFPDYKDHPFSWWEKKGVDLGVGTDNYITLSTNFIQEMLILLYSDPDNLKITKLLMVTTKERRRPYLSHLLWEMRKEIQGPKDA